MKGMGKYSRKRQKFKTHFWELVSGVREMMKFAIKAQTIMQKNITVDVSKISTVFFWGVIGEEMPEEMKLRLSENMVELCGNMPIKNVIVTEVSEAIFEDKMIASGDCYHLAGGRKKRQDKPEARRRCWVCDFICGLIHRRRNKRSVNDPTEGLAHVVLGHEEFGC